MKLILRYVAAAVFLGVVLASLLTDMASASVNRFSLGESSLFSCPPAMRHQVDFWIKIFTQYSTRQAVIHDNRYLNIIYSVVELTEDQSNSKNARIGLLAYEVSKYREILLKLAKLQPQDIENLTPEESRVYDMFKDIVGDDKFTEAAERLRAQMGQKDRFQKALSKSTMYMSEMERIFREEGVPVELTRLPFVESAFDLSAYSWAKAAGIWQFTDYTGKIFLKMNSIVDERIDPMKSTKAAARLLSENYAQLGSWPLAVTAYNHGAAGMSRAIKTLSTKDIAEIVEKYKGPSFGFASRNYYAEFIAVLEILEDYQKYFGDIEFLHPEQFEVLRTGRAIKLSAIAAACSLDDIRRLNPELKASVLASKTAIPCDYYLKLPPGTKDSIKDTVKTQIPSLNESKSLSKKKREPQKEAVHIKPDTQLTTVDTTKSSEFAPEKSATQTAESDKKPTVETVTKKTDKPAADSTKKPSDAAKKPETTSSDTKKSDKKPAIETVAKNTEKTVPEHKKPSDAAKKPETTSSDTKKSDKKSAVETVAKKTEKPLPEHKKPSDAAKKPETATSDTKKSDKKSAVETVAKKTEKTVSEHKKPSDAAKKPEKTTSDTKKSDKKPVVEAVAKTTDKPEAEHKKPSDTAKKPEDKRAAIRQHKVTSGQSLVTIAKMYNISVKELMRANSISDPMKIKIGIVLQIPAKS